MSSRFRKAAVSLLVSTAVLLACAAPSHARLQPRRAFEDPAVHAPRGFVASLLQHLLDFAGGAMDPNGCH